MTIKYTVTEVTTGSISVEYDNGTFKSYAKIPLKKGENKTKVEDRIRAYYNELDDYDSLADIPLSNGDTATIQTTSEQVAATNQTALEKWEAELIDWQEQRHQSYPSWEAQMDALYWGRNGNTALQDTIDAEIKSVKDSIPKGSASKTNKEFFG